MGKNNKHKNFNRPSDPMANVKTMGREGLRIIKDIAFGRYNIYNEGHVFRNEVFVNAIITEVDKKLSDYSIIINSVQVVYGGTPNPVIDNFLNRYMRSYEAYSLIRTTLANIVSSGGDTGFLLILANRLPAYKYNI